jgi:filamentous hemagglutinin
VKAGEVVEYSATPLYKGTNLIPRGITLQARGSGGFTLDVTILNPKGF